MTNEKVLARMQASTVRRALGVAAMAGFGGLMLYTGLARPPDSLFWQGTAILGGGLGLWLAWAMFHATRDCVELTREGLRSGADGWIARMDEIEGIDRGHFAFRPSNGVLVRLKHKGPARWRPGLWWRAGAHLGLGGVTPGYQAKVMADMLAGLLAEAQDRAAR